MSRARVALATVVAVGCLVCATTLVSSPALAAPTARATAAQTLSAAADLVPVVVKTSLTGTHRWYRQTFHGLPVLDSYYVQHLDPAGRLTSVGDGRLAVPATLSVAPTVSTGSAVSVGVAASARASATGPQAARPAKDIAAIPLTAVSASAASATLAVRGGSAPALVWSVITRSDGGVTRTLVDAHTGGLLGTRLLTKNVDGKGRAFDPNPVVDLRNESLKDRKDSNQRVLWPAYKNVLLHDLTGNGYLVGRYARVVKARNGLAYSKNNSFSYLRHDHRFEQANAYYAIDTAQRYIQQLGFTDVNNESQDLIIDTYRGDNSFYEPSRDTITYGIGGVDDAEDNEVVWHEYGHSIQDDQSPGYGSSEQAGATGEGFGDYWAVTMSQATSRGFDLPCVMDWDSTSYTSGPSHCLRRTDTGKTVKDVDGEVHDDGEIWSNALWDINRALGRTVANRIILESQFYNVPDTTFRAAALNTIASARALYGAGAQAKVRAAFHARKIL